MKYLKVKSINPLHTKKIFLDIKVNSKDSLFTIQDSKVLTHNSGNIGAVQHFATGALTVNLAGKLTIKPPDEDTNIYSVGVSLNPFASTNDPPRILMSASQQRHVIPVENSQRPYILSGYETLPAILSSSTFAVKAKENGTIIKVTDSFIVIQYDNGKKEVFNIEPSGAGTVNVDLEYNVLVTEGQKVKKNELLAANKFFFDNQGIYTGGVRMYTVYMPYRGYNYEDGLICSETAAKKLAISVHIDKREIEINKDETIVKFINKLGHVPAKQPLVVTKPKNELISSEDYEINPDVLTISGYKLYPLEYDTDILAIEIYAPSKEFVNNYFPELMPLIKNQIKDANDKINQYKTYNVEPDKITRLKANPFGVKYKGNKLENKIVVRYIYRYGNSVKLGDKFANLHGNKGCVSRIIPDDLMPRDLNGKIFDVIANPLGVVSRKNPGQLLELYFSKACYFITQKLKDSMKYGGSDEAINILKEFYSTVYEYKPNVKNQLLNQLNNMSKEDKQHLIENFINEGVTIYSPPVNGLGIKDLMNVFNHYGWKVKDYVILPEFGNVKTKNQVAFGYIYWMKLEQLAETKASARSFGKSYKSKTLQPVGEKGAKAQREGELDTWSLLSWGAKDIIKEFTTLQSDDIKAKYQAVNSIMNKGEVSLDDINFSSPLSNRMLKAYIAGMMITDDLDV